MDKLIMGTTNPGKINQLNDCLITIGINVVGVEDKSMLPHVEEDGATVLENARKKAIVYANTLGQRVISMDNALYIDGLSDEQQPGIYVRRINGEHENNDEELLNHFERIIASIGNRVTGYWEFGICIADPDGETWETVIKSPRLFASSRSDQMVEGYPLESIQIDPESGQYLSELPPEDRARFWQKAIGPKLVAFVQSIA